MLWSQLPPLLRENSQSLAKSAKNAIFSEKAVDVENIDVIVSLGALPKKEAYFVVFFFEGNDSLCLAEKQRYRLLKNSEISVF